MIVPLEEIIGRSRGGVVVSQQYRELARQGLITSEEPIPEKSFQPGSMELRVSDKAHKLSAISKPKEGEKVWPLLKDKKQYSLDLNGDQPLQVGNVYAIPLLEVLDSPKEDIKVKGSYVKEIKNGEPVFEEREITIPKALRGKINPKSTIGRTDIFVNIIADGCGSFDTIPQNYRGMLYAIVVPLSFDVFLRPGTPIAQLRYFIGDPTLSDEELRKVHQVDPLAYEGLEEPKVIENPLIEEGLVMHASMDNGEYPTAYTPTRGRRPPAVDLEKGYNKELFFDVIARQTGQDLFVKEHCFYLTSDKERIRIRNDLVAEITAYDPRLGELRNHCAGFLDPSNGYGRKGDQKGFHTTQEIRSNLPYLMRDREKIARVKFERCLETPDKLYGESKNNYMNQVGGPRLPKWCH